MAILTERKCGHLVEECTRVCPECGYDPDCMCCMLYNARKEEEDGHVEGPVQEMYL